MIRGTNAQFKFKLPYAKDELMWVTIKFWQPGNNNSHLPIVKNLEHCVVLDNPKELYVSLTIDESLRFSEKHKGKVQLRAQYIGDGTIFGNKIPQIFTVYQMHDGNLDKEPIVPTPNEEGFIVLDGETIITS